VVCTIGVEVVIGGILRIPLRWVCTVVPQYVCTGVYTLIDLLYLGYTHTYTGIGLHVLGVLLHIRCTV
jgi:hypothetical protein